MTLVLFACGCYSGVAFMSILQLRQGDVVLEVTRAVEVTRQTVVTQLVPVEATRVERVVITATPDPSQPTSVQPSPPTPLPGSFVVDGFLWDPEEPDVLLVVYSDVHQSEPSEVEFGQWADRGELCLIEPGAPYLLEAAVRAPPGAVGVRLLSGDCAGYRGWIAAQYAHAEPMPGASTSPG